MSDNPDRSKKNEKRKNAVHTLSVYFKDTRHVSLACSEKKIKILFKPALFLSKTSTTSESSIDKKICCHFFFFGATAPIWALAYLHEILFHFVFLDLKTVGRTPWTGDQLYLYTNTKKNT
jgi:hypothetical protein